MLENALKTLQIPKISQGSMPPDPPNASQSGPLALHFITAAYFHFPATYLKTY